MPDVHAPLPATQFSASTRTAESPLSLKPLLLIGAIVIICFILAVSGLWWGLGMDKPPVLRTEFNRPQPVESASAATLPPAAAASAPQPEEAATSVAPSVDTSAAPIAEAADAAPTATEPTLAQQTADTPPLALTTPDQEQTPPPVLAPSGPETVAALAPDIKSITPPVPRTNPRPASRQKQTPPVWINDLREELADCEGSFFCRERIRKKYCTGYENSLSECFSKSRL
jgi:cytoskeletal protein RodZ